MCWFHAGVVAHSTMSASPGSLETRHGALSNSSPTGHPWLSTLFHSPVSPRIPHSHSLHARYENDHISVKEYKREESPEKNRIRSISTVGSGISLTCHSIFILVHQVLSNVGYGVTSLLNLALLLPPTMANDPKIDNYTLTWCLLSSLPMGSSLNMRSGQLALGSTWNLVVYVFIINIHK